MGGILFQSGRGSLWFFLRRDRWISGWRVKLLRDLRDHSFWELAKGFTDETEWFVGGKSALRIAEGFIHFNLFDQAGKWLAKARQMGADYNETSKIELPAKSVLTTGKIFGHIRINGKAAQNAKAAIFTADRLKPDEIKLWSLRLAMVDAQDLGPKGGFSFENLGEEQYVLAILTDTTILASDTSTMHITEVSTRIAGGLRKPPKGGRRYWETPSGDC